MKKVTLMIVVATMMTGLCSAQDTETTTYFGEKNGFEIDFPSDWGVSLVETKVMFAYNTTLIGVIGDTPGAVVQLRVTYPCKNPKSDMKSWLSIFEKGAKKSKDPKFLIHSQGEGSTPGGKEFSYVDYTYTLVGEDGQGTITRRKFYVTCNSIKGTRFSFAFFFETNEQDWDKFKTIYENIFNSVTYK
ncbi:MAG TPA: hypothetical protein PK185_11965 [Cyclobacteriaceae bacterium]|nr:hypothetical protein [Cyclobacteriaceae bacterium]HRK54623.1 hypothetical protein [Cyclobacteriaceae bacterium]